LFPDDDVSLLISEFCGSSGMIRGPLLPHELTKNITKITIIKLARLKRE
tara:strand:+ start:32 stop:178 length:147 start_codon:yes stop_codon:yes gene_type:complete